MARYDIPMDEIENKLRSFKEMGKQNVTEQEERRMEQMMMEIQLHMKKKEEGKLPLGNNKNGSLERNLKWDSEIHKAYNTVMWKQVQIIIIVIQRVPNNKISNCKEFYLPHKPVSWKKFNKQDYELFMTLGWNLK